MTLSDLLAPATLILILGSLSMHSKHESEYRAYHPKGGPSIHWIDKEIKENKVIFDSYKKECIKEHGVQYIDRYMDCATQHMREYLNEQGN